MRLKSHRFAANQLRVYTLGLYTVTYLTETQSRGARAPNTGKLAIVQRSTEGDSCIHTDAGGSSSQCLIVQTQGLEVADDIYQLHCA